MKGYGQISTIFTDTNLWTKTESDRPGDTYGQIFTVKLQIQTYEQVFTYWQILTDIGADTNIWTDIYILKYTDKDLQIQKHQQILTYIIYPQIISI